MPLLLMSFIVLRLMHCNTVQYYVFCILEPSATLEKADLLLLRGKALNVLPTFDQTAHDALAKAIKLNPTLVEAWIQLGESYWKNGDVEGARNCFSGALNHVG